MIDEPERMTLTRGAYRGNKADFSGGETLVVHFNPTEYTLNKSSSYAEAAIPGLDVPVIQFSRGEARSLDFELLLDTITYGDQADIRETHLQALEKFLYVDGDLHAPPPCRINWGSLVFVGVVQDVKKRFVLFTREGIPVRARVTVTVKEYVPVDIQVRRNPRASPDRLKTWRVREGDQLWTLAHRAYGDPALWKRIAEANDIHDPLALEVGRDLRIPVLEQR